MSFLVYSELNIFALIFLILIFANVRSSGEKYLYEQKLFIAMLVSIAALLTLDTIQWVLNGMAGGAARFIMLLISTVYCAMTPLPCFIWSLYADYQLFRDENHVKKTMRVLILPMIVNSVIAVLSIFYGLAFRIDSSNIYHRGVFFYLMASICYIYIVYSFLSIIINRRRIEQRIIHPLLLFAAPPIAAGIIQTIFYGVSVVWAAASVSAMVIYTNIQNRQLYTDYLTGVYNRRQLERYISEFCRDSMEKGKMAGIMIDIDSFKNINDDWGHMEGDRALVEASNILKSSFSKNDLICRFGGDEFFVLLQVFDREELHDKVKWLKANERKFNTQKITPYSISFSIGYDIYDGSSGMTYQQFLKHIDLLMYEHKKSNRVKPRVH